jgi:hypothetical protein
MISPSSSSANIFVVHAQKLNNSDISNWNFSVFQNSTKGLSVKYPTNWTIIEPTGNETFRVQDDQNGHFVIIVDNSTKVSLEDYSIKYIQSKNSSLSDFIPIFSNPFEIIEKNTNYTMADKPAVKLVYKYPCMPDLATCTVLDIWTTTANKAFHAIYQALPMLDLELDPSMPIVQYMIESINITQSD